MKKVFDFGKIDYNRTGRKINRVTVEINLNTKGGEETFTVDPKTRERIYTGEKTPEYTEFTASAYIWNGRNTDCVMCGQCLDDIAKYIHNSTFKKILNFWQKYHLNGMNAGTKEQSEAIDKWLAEGNKYDYTKVCEYLKSIGLYEVNYTGKSVGRIYDNEPYKYGHGWLVRDIPENDLAEIKALFEQ